MRFTLFVFLTLFSSSIAVGQEKKKLKDVITVSGYVKYMNTSSFVSLDSVISDNLIHNRINFKAFLSNRFTAVVGMRNRIFYGEATRMNPYLGDMLDADPGQMDLSFVPVDKKAIVVHSILDRAYLKYISDKWEVRLGRQRINWGVNLAWNPNDLFNAYSLIDFDYQERPGADAVRVQYFPGGLASLDLAYQPGNGLDSSIVAGMWKFNKWKYDFQLLAGSYYSDMAIGAGWAGNVKKAGFKGEATYFQPRENFSDTTGVLSSSITLDYSFKNGLYINASALYNSGGLDQISSTANPTQGLIGIISAKNLMPSKLTYFAQASGAFNPALNGSLSAFFMQGFNILLVMPSVSYTMHESWEIMLLGQSYFGEVNSVFKGLGTGIYLRLMYSF